MINSWELGLAHWGEHSELREKREDQVQVGSKLGDIEICYIDNTTKIPVIYSTLKNRYQISKRKETYTVL